MKYYLTDTHTHLDFYAKEQLFNVLTETFECGVHRVIVPAVQGHVESICPIPVDLKIYYTYGIHPSYINQSNFSIDPCLIDKVIAIGECGLESQKYSKVDENKQEEVFCKQIELAKVYNLPLIIHNIHATDRIHYFIKKYNFTNGGIIHGFNGNEFQANEWIKRGFFLGVGFQITNPNANKLIKTIKNIGYESIVMETDSPSVVPHGIVKGLCLSYPKNIYKVLECLSNICNCSKEDILFKTEKNVDSFILRKNKN